MDDSTRVGCDVSVFAHVVLVAVVNAGGEGGALDRPAPKGPHPVLCPGLIQEREEKRGRGARSLRVCVCVRVCACVCMSMCTRISLSLSL